MSRPRPAHLAAASAVLGLPAADPTLPHALRDLQAYLCHGASALGLSSSLGPLLQICQTGFGGSPDPERGVTDRRFGFGASPSPITLARMVQPVLAAMLPIHQSVLWQHHGPEVWGPVLERAYGARAAAAVLKGTGGLPGVALLTTEAEEGWALARPTAAPEREPKWSTPGGWLVALCISTAHEGREQAARVRVAARALLEEAEAVYLDRMGVVREARREERVRHARAKVVRRPRPLPIMASASVGLL